MYVVINTIRVKKGYGPQLVERFKTPKGVHQMPGFIRFELWQTEHEQEEFEEFQACTVWENEQAFLNWVNSAAFRKAHEASNQRPKDYIIDSRSSKHRIVAHYTAHPTSDS